MGKAIMYERIYADLLAKIQNGDYQPGDRLPSEKESAELYGVSRITAKKAMDMLAKEKKISREPDRKSTRLNSSHRSLSRMPSSA